MERFEWKNSYDLGKKIEEMKENHYKHIFPQGWENILLIASRLYDNEKLLVAYVENEKAGICIAEFWKNGIKLRDFSVLPEYRGLNMGGKMLKEIELQAENFETISTIAYPQPKSPEHFKDIERFGMARFYMAHGFWSSPPTDISIIEAAGLKAYARQFPEYLPLMKQYRKLVIK